MDNESWENPPTFQKSSEGFMRYFSKPDPVIIKATNDLIRNKESKVLEEMRRLKLLKKVQYRFNRK